MAFELPSLPYAEDALEPHIDARTMGIHHGKHHAAYTGNLNAAIEGTPLDGMSIEAILGDLNAVPENIRTAVRNNGGGHANHSLFWTVMSGDSGAPLKLRGSCDGSSPPSLLSRSSSATWAMRRLHAAVAAALVSPPNCTSRVLL